MPPVIVAVAAIAASYAAAAAAVSVGLVVAGTFGAALIAGAAGLLVSTIGGMLIASNKPPGSTPLGGQTVTLKAPTAARRIIYGRTRVGGITLLETAISARSNSNERLLLVIAWAGHECDAIEMFWGGSSRIPIAVNTDPGHPGTQMPVLGDTDNPTNSPYGGINNEGAMYFSSHLGGAGQVADQDLINWNVGWTPAHILTNVCYTFFHLFYWPQFYPTGIPNLTALIRGRKCYDPRTGTTAWTQNPILCVRDYLTALDPNGNPIGLGCAASELDDDSFIAAANICDELVTLSDGTLATFTDDTSATISTGTPVILAVGASVTYGAGLSATMTYATGCIVVNGLIVSTVAPTTAVTFGDGSTGTLPFGTQLTLTLGMVITFSDGISASLASAAGATEPQFTMNGSFTTDQSPLQIVQDMLTACAGHLVYESGKYRVYAAAYQPPATGITINETFLRGKITVQDGPSRQNMFNTVRGTYIDPTKNYQPGDFIPVENTFFRTADGGYEIPTDLQLPYTQSPTMAQRLATLVLNRSRLITVTMECNFRATQLRVGDCYNVSIGLLGWANKQFKVTSWSFVEGGGIDIELEEEDSNTYLTGPGQMLIPNSETNLPSPLFVAPPTNVVANVSAHVQGDGTSVPTLTIAWDASIGPFVDHYEVQFSLDGGTTWQDRIVGRDVTQLVLSPAVDGISYIARVRSYNTLSVPSFWANSATSATPTVDQTAPPAPTGVTATGGNALVRVGWVMPVLPAYNPGAIGSVQIWGVAAVATGETPAAAGASLRGAILGTSFNDTNLGFLEPHTYWVRFVSLSGIVGPFSSGVFTTTAASISIPPNSITDNLLAAALAEPIASITSSSAVAGSIASQLAQLAEQVAGAHLSLSDVQAYLQKTFVQAKSELTSYTDGATQAEAAQRLSLAGVVAGNFSLLTNSYNVLTNQQSATATALLSLTAGFSGNLAAFQTVYTATASLTTANATAISTLQTSVGGNTSSISTQGTSIGGLQAQYTVKVDVNGNVAGYGLASVSNSGTVTSSFIVRADSFQIRNPVSGGAEITPFQVVSGNVYINTAYIQTINAGQIGSGSISTAMLTIFANSSGTSGLAVYGAAGQLILGINGLGNDIVGTGTMTQNSVTVLYDAYSAGIITLPNDGGWRDLQLLSVTLPSPPTGSTTPPTGTMLNFSVFLTDPGASPTGGNNDSGGGDGGGGDGD